MQQFVPAKKRVVVFLCALAVCGVAAFTLLWSWGLRAVRVLDPAEYTQQAPAGFVFDTACSLRDGVLCVDGYAAVEGERFESVDTRVVLYHAEDDTYILLSTQMVESEAARQATGLPLAQYGGFSARAKASGLEHPAEEYEICIAYRNDGHNALVHTGRRVEVAQ